MQDYCIHSVVISLILQFSCLHRHQLDPEMLKIIKTDILSFGILILRLFCKKSIPQDNNILIKWVSVQFFLAAFSTDTICIFQINEYFWSWNLKSISSFVKLKYCSVSVRCSQAQPLLSSHAYYEMLDEEEYPDMFGMLRVMYVATQCIKARHTSRPSASKVG